MMKRIKHKLMTINNNEYNLMIMIDSKIMYSNMSA